MIHQINNTTEYNRYPDIFRKCKVYFKGKQPDILSFGCSSGEECFTLSREYFKRSKVCGVDVDQNILKRAEITNAHKNICYNSHITGEFDIIFCMSVLCRWEDTKDLQDCLEVYKFTDFEKQLVTLDRHLKKGGLLVIYNANFRFSDTKLYKYYKAMKWKHNSGFVHKFDKQNKRVNEEYNEVIFIKK